MQHYVYVIASEKTFKIGVSKNCENRLKALQTANPHKIKLVCKIRCNTKEFAYKLESILHMRYAKHRLKGEWFALSVLDSVLSDLRLIELLNKEYRLYSYLAVNVHSIRFYSWPIKENKLDKTKRNEHILDKFRVAAKEYTKNKQ